MITGISGVVSQIENLVQEETNSMHTAIPGTILSFDKQTGRATVQPKGKIKMSETEYLDYPQLNDIPVVFPFCSSLSAGIAFPVNAGDTCLLIFCEQALDSWLGKGDTTSELKYSLTNAVAIPGLMKFSPDAAFEASDKQCLVVACGSNKIKVGKDKTEFSGNVVIDGNLDVKGKINNQ